MNAHKDAHQDSLSCSVAAKKQVVAQHPLLYCVLHYLKSFRLLLLFKCHITSMVGTVGKGLVWFFSSFEVLSIIFGQEVRRLRLGKCIYIC